MADINISAKVPFEGLLVALLNALETRRETMSQEHRDEFDRLRLKHLKRVDAILDKVVGLIT
jgi:hypothetical protein